MKNRNLHASVLCHQYLSLCTLLINGNHTKFPNSILEHCSCPAGRTCIQTGELSPADMLLCAIWRTKMLC
jgi:hypothetical protein